MIRVVPLAGTWIETGGDKEKFWKILVVPLAGTWIETKPVILHQSETIRRSPCGNVD